MRAAACGRSHTLPYYSGSANYIRNPDYIGNANYIGNASPTRPEARGTEHLVSGGHLADAPEPLGPPVGNGPLQHGSHWLELERGRRLLAQEF